MLAEREEERDLELLLEQGSTDSCLDEPDAAALATTPCIALQKASIVVFQDKIYKVKHIYSTYSCAYDYFLARTNALVNITNEFSYEFSIHWDDKTINKYDSFSTAPKTETFKEFVENARDVSEKTENELFELHKSLLRSRIVHKLLDSPSKETCKLHERLHRDFLKEEINDFFKKIPESIYKWANEGCNVVDFTIATFNESTMTRYGGVKKLSICSDGVVRSQFSDYVYFLLGAFFPRHDDEVDSQMWIGSHLASRIRLIYPHFTVEIKPLPGTIFPKFIVELNVSTTGILK